MSNYTSQDAEIKNSYFSRTATQIARESVAPKAPATMASAIAEANRTLENAISQYGKNLKKVVIKRYAIK